jgi:hypothetical protein
MLILCSNDYTVKKVSDIPVWDGKIANISYCVRLCFFRMKICDSLTLSLSIRRFQYANLDVHQNRLMYICKKKSFYMLQNALRTI